MVWRSGIRQIWEIHATSLPGLAQRLHEFPKSEGFKAMFGLVNPNSEIPTALWLSVKLSTRGSLPRLYEERLVELEVYTNQS